MLITRLSLKNFRNISELNISPGPAFNLLVGKNAQGKTNIIESISLISTGASFKASDFRDMIRWGSTRAEVAAWALGAAGDDRIVVTMDDGRKSFLKNGKRAVPSRSSRVCTVIFAPEEIMLIKDEPSRRRRYMDALISQVSPAHRTTVGKYEKVVRQRNRLLSDTDISNSVREAGLRPWDEQLASLGARIITSRGSWCERLDEFIPLHYGGIAPADERARLKYAPCCTAGAVSEGPLAIEKELARELARRRPDELMRGFSLVGPHRDDFRAMIGESEISHYGSQGQHRSFVLALKMAEMSLLRETTGEEPILLLDDVASELDQRRNRFFFENLMEARGQVFITATKDSDVGTGGLEDMVVFDVDDGQASPRK